MGYQKHQGVWVRINLGQERIRGEDEGEEGEHLDDREPQGPLSLPPLAIAPSSPLVAGPSSATPLTVPQHFTALASPHTPWAHQSFSAEGIMDQIMDQMGAMFADFRSQILQSHDELRKYT